GSTLNRIDKGGGTPAPLAQGVASGAIVQDDANIYWWSNGIQRVPKAGGTPQPVVAEGGATFAVGGSRVYWPQLAPFQLNPTYRCGFLYGAPKDGSGPASLVWSSPVPPSDMIGPSVLLADESFVYWSGPPLDAPQPNVFQIDPATGTTD